MNLRLGQRVYGLGAIALGGITLAWHQIDALGSVTHPDVLIYIVSAVEITGGVAIYWQRTSGIGAVTLGVIFSLFSLYWIPDIVKTPLAFWCWGNFFEQLSVVLGSAFVLASTLHNNPQRAQKIVKASVIWYGICVLTYALYQLFYLKYTAGLVPVWIPPGQMFWAVATSVAFGLAAYAILTGPFGYLATRLLTIMLFLFGLLVWLPRAVASPTTLSNWREFVENLLMTGVAWIVAEFHSRPYALSGISGDKQKDNQEKK